MFFHRIYTAGLSIYSYLLGDETTKRCIVIDPVRNVVPYIIHAQNGGYDITDILETHVHADFVSGSRELKHQLNEKPRIHASGMGGKGWMPAYADEIVQNGSELKIGQLRLKPVHTPGHTAEHIIWICFDDSRNSNQPWFAFTGDCLFVGSIGRPDLLGKEAMILAPQLYHTLFDVLAALPDFMEIFPSHGEGSLCGKSLKTRGSSSLGYERLCNPYLKRESEKEWIEKVDKDLLPPPPYFQRMKKINVAGAPLLNTLKTSKWKMGTPSSQLDKLFLLDTRLPDTFAISHIKASINIPVSPTFAQWAGWMLPEKGPIGLIVENPHAATELIDLLRLMGFDQEISIIHFAEVENSDYTFVSFPMMDVHELAKQMPSFASLFLVDVRTPEEWSAGHIPGSHHIELLDLEKSQHQLPKNQLIAFICRSGHRASLAASLLEIAGFPVANIQGGMEAWTHSDLPIKKGKI